LKKTEKTVKNQKREFEKEKEKKKKRMTPQTENVLKQNVWPNAISRGA
jgi:hypothetical protein